jgi:hypothetical protein
MPYCPVFDNDYFGTNSTLFIPAFKSSQKLRSSNSEATSHRLDNKGPDEWEVHKKLRVRKEELKKHTDENDVIKHNKHHTTNLLSRPNPSTFTDRDVIVTAVTCTQPPSSLFTNPPQTPHIQPIVYNPTPNEHTQDMHCHITCTSSSCECNDTECKHTTPCTPPSTQIEPKPVQKEDRGQSKDDGKG